MKGASDTGRTSTVYGPVLSWRLGRSLGIDVLPPPKTCTFDCVYCQLGRTVRKVSGLVQAQVSKKEVLEDLEKALALLDPSSIDYITFSGSGEPTLVPELGEMIEGVRCLVEKPIAVLTNSSLVNLVEVRRNLVTADLVVAKLDAPDQPALEATNRPAEGILHEDIVGGLMKLRNEVRGKLALQIMFFESKVGGLTNADEETIANLTRLTELIEPDEVQINTPTRPPSEGHVLALRPSLIQSIAERFSASARQSKVVSRYDKKAGDMPKRIGCENVESEVLGLIGRRPCRPPDIAASLNLSTEVVMEVLNNLKIQGRVSEIEYAGEEYYKTP
jgi:wyosine [tRNA(Phe)-imidazoG37] synthetase (radical SAM superfamily)